MFQIGFSELCVIFVIALIVLGPERLPKVARTVGRWTGQARGYMNRLSTELERETHAAEIRKKIDEAQASARAEFALAESQTAALRKDTMNAIPPPAADKTD